MKSWVLQPLLLAVLLSARLRFGNAEGDPLPQSLVDLVLESPISSVEDLKLLLKQEASSIEDTEDEHDSLPHPTHGRYIRSLVEAQPAQKAECKVRTEVMEITRSMLDRRNADFMLFPPCVEVQRCSGCCNTEHLQCVPTVTSSRYLQDDAGLFEARDDLRQFHRLIKALSKDGGQLVSAGSQAWSFLGVLMLKVAYLYLPQIS
ncbi:hypothetical protein CHARACLAT_015411 [Characodon lateralis]|uniref:Platelet-derived growth factor (PDGF) family profile domain-containing protein n=1 Tax=Characodon lateralis TaxID=208331 RepID=A0ABU7E0Q3_9TELE|nr:hypothetical protein [Characodon lateralis]